MQDEDIVKKIEKKKYLESLKRKYPKEEKLLSLVEEDLNYGLSIAQVSQYVTSNVSFEEKKKLSLKMRSSDAEESVSFSLESEVEKIAKLLYAILDRVEQQQIVMDGLVDRFVCYEEEKEDLIKNISDKDKIIKNMKEQVAESDRLRREIEKRLEQEEARNRAKLLPWRKKVRNELICKIAEQKLSAEQIAQIRRALRKGMNEKQVSYMVEHSMDVAQMKEVIELTLIQNESKGKRRIQI